LTQSTMPAAIFDALVPAMLEDSRRPPDWFIDLMMSAASHFLLGPVGCRRVVVRRFQGPHHHQRVGGPPAIAPRTTRPQSAADARLSACSQASNETASICNCLRPDVPRVRHRSQ
jgi:hypothetical protein